MIIIPILLVIYFVVPIALGLALAFMLHIPFRSLKKKNKSLRGYMRFRLAIAALGPIAMITFKLTGGYANILSSEFSPIGTDERGLLIYVISHTIIAFTIISVIELIAVAANRDYEAAQTNAAINVTGANQSGDGQ
ncbi:MAG: hypothetical protein ACSHX4_05255 [Opitutaceae bacterium]